MMTYSPPRRPARTGFTLIELLVVISIVALMIAILLPALSAARGTARSVQCLSTQRQMGIMFAGYMDSNQGWSPWAALNTPDWSNYISWTAALDMWNSGRSVPMANMPTSGVGAPHNLFFRCPSDERTAWAAYTHSYKTNWAFMWQVQTNAPTAIKNARRVHEREILSPANKIAVAEGRTGAVGEHFSIRQPQAFLAPADGGVDKRHLGSANYLYFDGHASSSKEIPEFLHWSRN
jgi:prepilin-type N-terminal cleavage/methylation domain-containing protein/prepilin-type processing-associated H-X9-DG protein